MTDTMEDGPIDIMRLKDSHGIYQPASFDQKKVEYYMNQDGKWTDFATTTITTSFDKNDQSCTQTFQGVTGNPQGPWVK